MRMWIFHDITKFLKSSACGGVANGSALLGVPRLCCAKKRARITTTTQILILRSSNCPEAESELKKSVWPLFNSMNNHLTLNTT